LYRIKGLHAWTCTPFFHFWDRAETGWAESAEAAKLVFGKVREVEGHLNVVAGLASVSCSDDQKLIAAIEDVSRNIDTIASSMVAGVSEKLEFD